MKLSTLFHLPFSNDQGRPEIERLHPRLVKLFALVALPLSLLPPIMLYYAGSVQPEIFPPQLAGKDWGAIAVVFFVAEMATLAFMGWFIRQVADGNGLRIDYHDAYVIAAIAPIPMWLSALGLLMPSLGFSVVLALVGLGLSCSLVYHGIEGLTHSREDVSAAGIVQTVIGAGLVAWALLLMLLLLL
jgi:hypothetical protein